MSKLSVFIVLVIAACLEFSPALAVPTSCRIKCSDNPPLAWATDGRNCLVFQNSCQLQSQNCQRADYDEPTLTSVDRDDCLKNCHFGCTREFDQVCTSNNNVTKTFNNPCLWSEEMCKSGEPYVFQFRGRCATDS